MILCNVIKFCFFITCYNERLLLRAERIVIVIYVAKIIFFFVNSKSKEWGGKCNLLIFFITFVVLLQRDFSYGKNRYNK